MNVVKCKNGHFFDGDSYATCPHCGAAVETGSAPMPSPVAEQEKKRFGFGHRKNSQNAPAGTPAGVVVPPARPEVYRGDELTDSYPPAMINRQPEMPEPYVPTPAQPPVAPPAGALSGEHTLDFWSDPAVAQQTPQEQPEEPQNPFGVIAEPAASESAQEPVQEAEVNPFMAEVQNPFLSEAQVPEATGEAFFAAETPVAPAEEAPFAETPVAEPEARHAAPETDAVSLAEAISKASANSEGKTMSYFSVAAMGAEPAAPKKPAVDPVVGWLVCVGGNHLGESFSMTAGKNSIGRNEDNRIVLSRDNKVSRSKHALIVYEPKKRNFYLQPGDSSGLTYLNDNYIEESTKLERNDVVELGDSKFVFVPLCDETFSWEEYLK